MYAPERRPARLALAIALALPLGSALACGPDFSMRLLDDRANSLAELPEGNFAFEITRLAPPIPGLKPVTEASLVPRWEEDNGAYLQQRDEREKSELGEAMWQRVQALRSLDDAQRAEAEGQDLPAEIRLYTAGAVAFQGDPALAVDYFRRVLALPDAERRTRSTWAAYSMGRTLAASSRALPASDEVLSDEEITQRLQANAEAARGPSASPAHWPSRASTTRWSWPPPASARKPCWPRKPATGARPSASTPTRRRCTPTPATAPCAN